MAEPDIRRAAVEVAAARARDEWLALIGRVADADLAAIVAATIDGGPVRGRTMGDDGVTPVPFTHQLTAADPGRRRAPGATADSHPIGAR